MVSESQKNLKPRPPIVVVMGHVDHGKTTLLDYIRKTNVAGREAGGITQAISAYEIIHDSHESQMNADSTLNNAEKSPRPSALSPRSSAKGNFAPHGRKITFIDTPGHEAFTKMRARGATAADLAILVVAADEGVKPQTLEAVKILSESKTLFVVALNKIDKPGVNLERVKNELTAAGVLLEGYGGHVSYEPISAKTGQGVDGLLDLVLLAAELEGLTYEPHARASGFVLESKVDPRRGISAAVIVKNGALARGAAIATKTARGRAKILENFLGQPADRLEPSSPALVIGFETLPEVGEEFTAGAEVDLEVASPSGLVARSTPLPAVSRVEPPAVSTSTSLSAGRVEPPATGEERALRVVLKASDRGSLEALSEIVKNLPAGKPPKVVDESVGDVTDNDARRAASTGALIVAFKSRIDRAVRNTAENMKVRIVASEVIYELVKAVEEAIKERETPKPAGILEVLAIFNQKKLDKQVIGGRVTYGLVKRNSPFEVVRSVNSGLRHAEGGTAEEPAPPADLVSPKADGEAVIGRGRIVSLEQQKQEATEVSEGKEAGLMVDSPVAIEVGDRLVFRT